MIQPNPLAIAQLSHYFILKLNPNAWGLPEIFPVHIIILQDCNKREWCFVFTGLLSSWPEV
jgi:hypothetical protein